MKKIAILAMLFFSCLMHVACADNNTNAKVDLVNQPIRQIAAKDNIKFGFAVTYDGLKDSTEYQNIVKTNASTIVPENALKWRITQPAQNQYNFNQSDYIINYAVLNNLQLRGHTLVWHSGIPQYVLDEKDPVKVEKLLRAHIATVVGRYKGKIKSWDVVNEVINVPDGEPNGLRNSYWYQVLGEKYIDIAFDEAHKADPDAILVYNEWGTEYSYSASVKKREAVIALIKRLQARNVPITGFGIQGHISTKGANYIDNSFTAFISELKSLGLNVYVTELDVSESEAIPGNLKKYTVPEAYNRFLDYALKSNEVSSVLIWGVFNRDHSLANYSKTPYYLFNPETGCNVNCVAVKETFESFEKIEKN